MATSGTVYSGYSMNSRLYVSWSQTGQSVANNTTTINWSAGIAVANGDKWYSNAVKITGVWINGTKVWSGGTYSNLTSNGNHAKGSGTVTIPHNADGTKTFVVQITGWFYGDGNVSGSKSFTLTTIPRATTPTLSASSVELGEAVTISMPRAASSFTHTLTYSIGSASGTIGSSLGTSKSWTPPVDLAEQITSATSGTVIITCKTYSGSTLIGTKTVSLKVTVPETIVNDAGETVYIGPAISSMIIEEAVAAVTEKFGARYVRTLSQLNVTIEAEGAYGSVIKSYSTPIDGVTYIQQAFTSNLINAAGTLTVTATVTDSRGRTAAFAQEITVVDYFSPTITDMTYIPCDADGTHNSSGTCTKVTISGKVAAVEEQNSRSLVLKYKAMSDEAYTARTVALSAWEFSADVVISGTDPTVTYEFVAELTDKVGATTYAITTGVPVISRLAGGKGVRLFGEAFQDGFMVGNVDYTITDEEYEELLNLVGGGVANKRRLADLMQLIAGRFKGVETHTILWTNPAPTQNFAAGIITIPGLSNYKKIRIVMRMTTGTLQQDEKVIDYEEGASVEFSHLFNMTLANSVYGEATRKLTLAPDGITVGNIPSKYTTHENVTERPYWLIPYIIYGINIM